jgi:hypothetical protein
MYLNKDLTRLTGLPQRILLHLSSNGALIPTAETDRQGTGRARVFPESEVVIAAILKAFSADTFPIGKLIHVARTVRLSLLNYTDRQIIVQAINGTPAFIIYDQRGITTISWFASDPKFWTDYFQNEMGDNNPKTTIVSLTGAFAHLRANNFTLEG